jgi:hypothetical protein
MHLFSIRRCLSILLFLFLCLPFFCPSVRGETVSPAPITELSIRVDENDWYNLQKAGPESDRITSCILNTTPCTVSYHGSPRSRRDAARPSYRISSPEQTLILKAEAFDPSMLREWMGYFIFRQAGILSPAAEPRILKVNDRPGTLYMAVTPVDARTIKRLYPKNFDKTALYYGYIKKPGEKRIRPDLRPATTRKLYPLAYEEIISPAGEEPFAPLDQLLKFLDNPPIQREELSMIIDTSQWLRWFAVSEIIENRDSPWFSGSRNYSLFRPPAGGWQILPWDPDHIYEGKGDFFPTSKVGGMEKLTSMPWFRKAVRKEVAQLVRGRLHHDIILTELKKLSEKIAPAIESGAAKGLNQKQWRMAVDMLVANIRNRHRHLLSLTKPDIAHQPR